MSLSMSDLYIGKVRRPYTDVDGIMKASSHFFTSSLQHLFFVVVVVVVVVV